MNTPASRPPQPRGESIWHRLLVSFRATGSGQRSDTNVATIVGGLSRAIVVPLARSYAAVLRRFSTRDTFMPTEQIEWVAHLESNWRVIRDELDRLRDGYDLPALIEMIPGEQSVADTRWKMLILRYFGHPVEANCSLCPRTARLLEQIPGLVSANFSVLQPGSRLAPHQGIFAGVVRYHLGLMVPGPDDLCGIRVGGETRHWREGSSLLFDDTRPHEAWNLTDRDRVILLLDVKRPLPTPLRWANEALLRLMSRFVMPPLVRADRMFPGSVRRAG